MGEITKILAKIEFKDNSAKKLDVELNIGTIGDKDIIHLQTEIWRIELYKASFIEFATSIVEASKKLKKIKNL